MKKFKITFEEYEEGQKLFAKEKMLKKKIMMIILFVCMGVIFTDAYTYQKISDPIYLIALSVISIFAALIFISYLFNNRIKKIYETSKGLQVDYQIKFNDKHSEWISVYGNSILPWNEIIDYKLTENILLIIISANGLRAIPLRAFESREEKEKFVGYLEKNLKKTQEI